MKYRKAISALIVVLAATTALPALGAQSARSHLTKQSKIAFTDVASQTREFMGYYRDIRLTTAQQAVKERALRSIPAPCCSDYSILTCCCPCNLAKSVWGLANYSVAKLGQNEKQLRATVLEWLRFVNPSGFSGDSCYVGRCGAPFSANGCGGMEEQRLILGARRG